MDEQASVGGSLLPNLRVDGAELDVALEASETKRAQKNHCPRCFAYCVLDLLEDVAERGQVFAGHPKFDAIAFQALRQQPIYG